MEDIKLVEEILQGNVESFSMLVKKYEMVIMRFIYSMIRNKEAAEDISQEVFITVYNKLDLFNKERKFSNWIIQIAKNKTIDYIRKNKKVQYANIEEIYSLKSNKATPEEIFEFKETKKEVKNFIETLNDIDKQILILKYTKNLRFEDIAEIMDMNISAVKRRYYKARDEFKKNRARAKRGVGYEM